MHFNLAVFEVVADTRQPRELHLTDEIPRTPVAEPDYRWAKRLATEGTT